MANSIALSSKYLPILDELYEVSAKTAILDADPDLVQATASAKSVLIAKYTLEGLGDYSRSTGYASGDVTLEWETHTFTHDRSKKFIVDSMDNLETMNISFGKLVGEFIRTEVVKEIDAIRLATCAGKAGNVATPATLTNSTVDEAIELGSVAMDEAGVGEDGRYLFITPTVLSLLRSSDNYVRNINGEAGGAIDNRVGTYNGMPVIKVPQNRMYTKIDLTDSGYIKNVATGKDINFMIVHEKAALGIIKHNNPKIILAADSENYDGDQFLYRVYHDLFVPDNKTAGIYLHNKA